jgi:hypothetical protein
VAEPGQVRQDELPRPAGPGRVRCDRADRVRHVGDHLRWVRRQGQLGQLPGRVPARPDWSGELPGAPIAAAYSFDGSSVSQGAIPTGLGTPGTAAVHGIESNPTGATVTTDADVTNNKYTNEKYTLDLNEATGGTYDLTVNCGSGAQTRTLKVSDIAKNISKALRTIPGCSLNIVVGGTGTGKTSDTGTCGIAATTADTSCAIVFAKTDGLGHFGGDIGGTNVPDSSADLSLVVGGTGPTFVKVTDGSTTVNAYNGTNCSVTRPATFGFPCGLG